MSLTRRNALLGATLGSLTAVAPQVAKAAHGAKPAGFLWGAGTSAFQVEGNNINSDAWLLESSRKAISPICPAMPAIIITASRAISACWRALA
jgi:beta-glucosidase